MNTTSDLQKLKLLPYLSLIGAGVLIFVSLFALAPSLPGIRDQFSGSPNVDVLTQMVGAGSAFTFALGCLFSSRVINRFGYRSIYVGSLLLLGVAGCSGALMNSLHAIILTRGIVGLAAAGIVNATLVAINRLLSEQGQARAFGLQGAIGSCIAIAAFPAIGALASISWRLAFAVHLIAFLFLPLALMLPAPRTPTLGEQANDDFLAAIRNMGALIAITAMFGGMVIFAIAMFAPLFLVSLGVTNTQLLSLVPTATVVGSAAGSYLFIPLRNHMSLSRLFSVTLAIEASGLIIISLSDSFWGVAAGALVAGTGTGLLAPILYSAVIKASPANPATGLGLVNALLYGAMILFPLVAMPFAQLIGGPRPMLMTLVGCVLILAVLFLVSGRLRAGETRAEVPGTPA